MHHTMVQNATCSTQHATCNMYRPSVQSAEHHSDAFELINKAHQLIDALTVHDMACAACAKPPLEEADLSTALEL